jgi:aminoglycoside 3-N-acetyltransferase I
MSARVLGPNDVRAFREVLAVFADAFEDPQHDRSNPPSDEYLTRLLADEVFIAVAAFDGTVVVGGLAGYVLRKFEQERSEFYIYDLAVLEAHRRNGHATAMIDALRAAVRQRGVYVIYVQADYGDDAAVALYTKLGVREDVMHFDIEP